MTTHVSRRNKQFMIVIDDDPDAFHSFAQSKKKRNPITANPSKNSYPWLYKALKNVDLISERRPAGTSLHEIGLPMINNRKDFLLVATSMTRRL